MQDKTECCLLQFPPRMVGIAIGRIFKAIPFRVEIVLLPIARYLLKDYKQAVALFGSEARRPHFFFAQYGADHH